MLEIWDAERFEKRMTQGRTSPLVIECIRENSSAIAPESDRTDVSSKSQKCLMLVKVPSSELQHRGLFSEAYGNLIAREFGVVTPYPALIHFSEEFVKALQYIKGIDKLHISEGTVVGCEYLTGLTPIIDTATRSIREQKDAQTIYGVDLLFQNPDRRPNNKNCALYQGGILAYDFEMAFSFLLPILNGKHKPWDVDLHAIYRQHLFYPELRTRIAELDWSDFMTCLESLTLDRFAELFSTVPSEWKNYAAKVQTHLCEVRDHAKEFKEALIRSL